MKADLKVRLYDRRGARGDALVTVAGRCNSALSAATKGHEDDDLATKNTKISKEEQKQSVLCKLCG